MQNPNRMCSDALCSSGIVVLHFFSSVSFVFRLVHVDPHGATKYVQPCGGILFEARILNASSYMWIRHPPCVRIKLVVCTCWVVAFCGCRLCVQLSISTWKLILSLSIIILHVGGGLRRFFFSFISSGFQLNFTGTLTRVRHTIQIVDFARIKLDQKRSSAEGNHMEKVCETESGWVKRERERDRDSMKWASLSVRYMRR